MTAPARTSITALPKGHEFAPVSFSISREQAAAYLEATGDTADYGDAVPPLAIVALALGALQEQLSLPSGALHTGQEVTHEAEARTGAPLTLGGRVAMRSERQGFVATAIDYEVTDGSTRVLSARTTIMAPGESA
jgi:hypothetical protein